jgi:hypothetical protein
VAGGSILSRNQFPIGRNGGRQSNYRNGNEKAKFAKY